MRKEKGTYAVSQVTNIDKVGISLSKRLHKFRGTEEVFSLSNWIDFLLNKVEFEVLQTVHKVSGNQV